MKIVSSPVKMQDVEYRVGTDGIANVWIRMNQNEVTETDSGRDYGENSPTQPSFQAEEVFIRVTPEIVSKAEIEADPEFFFTHMQDEEDGSNADHLHIETVRAAKRQEISDICETAIYKGVDVTLSDGSVQHFSLTEKDQINFFGKQAQMASGAEKLEYHSDGNQCTYYSKEDMSLITAAAMSFVSLMTTICNSIYYWISQCKTGSEIEEVTWTQDIPEEYQSEVLKDYLGSSADT